MAMTHIPAVRDKYRTANDGGGGGGGGDDDCVMTLLSV